MEWCTCCQRGSWVDADGTGRGITAEEQTRSATSVLHGSSERILWDIVRSTLEVDHGDGGLKMDAGAFCPGCSKSRRPEGSSASTTSATKLL